MVESAEASDPEPGAESTEAPTSPRNDDKLTATVACDVGLGLVSSAGAPPGSEGLPLGCAESDCMATFSLSNGGPFSASTADRRLDLYFWPQLTCLAYFCTSPRPPFHQIVVSRSLGAALGFSRTAAEPSSRESSCDRRELPPISQNRRAARATARSRSLGAC